MKAELQKEFDKLESKRRHLSYDEANAIEIKLLRILTKHLTEDVERLKEELSGYRKRNQENIDTVSYKGK